MKTSKVLFHSVRVLFGTAHLVAQSTADLIVEAETAIVSKTGFEDVDGKMIKFLNEDQRNKYKDFRRKNTGEIQNMVVSKTSMLLSKLNKEEEPKLKTA